MISKESLRLFYKKKCKEFYALNFEQKKNNDEKICLKLKEFIEKNSQFKNIGLYYCKNNEVDLTNFTSFLSASNINICIPYCEDGGKMNFTYCDHDYLHNDSNLQNWKNDIKVTKNKNFCIPDLVIAPALCCSKNGYRIGYGSGYYDRYLKDKNLFCIGICYSFQIADFENEKHDKKFDLVLTENESYSCK